MLSYVFNLPGKNRPVAACILSRWGLTRVQFDAEIETAIVQIRSALQVMGLRNSNDLEFLP
jgi:hypothetical protein